MPDSIPVALITHAGGAHVTAYLQALAATSACDSVVLVDPDGRWHDAAADILADKLTATLPDVDSLFKKPAPGMSLVTMEAGLAPPVIATCLEAGCHVFAEKPACLRAEDFEPLVAQADRQHRYLMLALANRLNPEIQAARKLIQAGTLGDLYGLEMHLVADQTRLTRSDYHRQWYAQKQRAGGGHLIWLGIHWLDLAMQLTGQDIVQATGFTANVGGQPIDVEDSATACLQFEDGMLGTHTSGYYLNRGYHSHIKIWGSRGWLRIEPTQKQLEWQVYTGPQADKLQRWDGDPDPRGYTPFVSAAVQACADMSEPPISSGHSLRALRTVFAIYQSAETGRSVRVNT